MTTINHDYIVYDKQGFLNTINKIVKRYKAQLNVVWGTPYTEKLYIPGFNMFTDTFGERGFNITRHPVTVTFDFEEFKIDGYTYLGCIKDELMMGLITIHGNDLLDGRDINEFVQSFDGIPCHNCNRKHKRKVGHLFLHNDSNDLLVFGSSCAKNFFGINFDRLLNFFERINISFGEGWDDDYVRGYRDKTIHWKSSAAFAFYWITKEGYLSGTKARELERNSTGFTARDSYNGNDNLMTEERMEEMSEMDIPDFDVLFSTDYAKDKDSPNDFEYNVQMLQEKMKNDFVTYHDHGFIAFMVWNQFFKAPRPEKVEYTIPEWAESGKRVRKGDMDITAEVTDIHEFEGSYGHTYIYTFVSENVRYKWFASNDQNVKVGDSVKLVAFTVKNTEDNKYGKAVMINRVMVHDLEGIATRGHSVAPRPPVVSKSDKEYFERMGIDC